MKIKTFSAIVIVVAFMIGGAQTTEAATTVTCYNSCSNTYSKKVGYWILELKCNSSSPTSYSGSLTVNGATVSYTKTCKPSVSVNASPKKIIRGKNTVVSWNSSRADSCSVPSGSEEPGWSGSKSTSGGNMVFTPNTTTSYELRCTNSSGSDNDSDTVQVADPLSVDIVVSADRNIGDTVQWSAINAAGGFVGSLSDYTLSWTGAVTGSGSYNGTNSGSAQYMYNKYGIVGFKTAQLTISDTLGNSTTTSKKIEIVDTRQPQ